MPRRQLTLLLLIGSLLPLLIGAVGCQQVTEVVKTATATATQVADETATTLPTMTPTPIPATATLTPTTSVSAEKPTPSPTPTEQSDKLTVEPMPTPPWQIPTVRENDWVKGGADAGLILVEYGDYQ